MLELVALAKNAPGVAAYRPSPQSGDEAVRAERLVNSVLYETDSEHSSEGELYAANVATILHRLFTGSPDIPKVGKRGNHIVISVDENSRVSGIDVNESPHSLDSVFKGIETAQALELAGTRGRSYALDIHAYTTIHNSYRDIRVGCQTVSCWDMTLLGISIDGYEARPYVLACKNGACHLVPVTICTFSNYSEDEDTSMGKHDVVQPRTSMINAVHVDLDLYVGVGTFACNEVRSIFPAIKCEDMSGRGRLEE